MPEPRDLDTTIDLETAALEAPRDRLSLLIYSRDGVKALPLPPGRRLVIGRGPPADAPLRDASISREHAALSRIGDEIWIEDLGSTNGTRVNDERVDGGRQRVRTGDEIVLGSVLASLHLLGSDETEVEGLCSHDQLQLLLEHDISRASFYRRELALLMVRGPDNSGSADPGARDPGAWIRQVQRELRPVDRAALFEPETLELLVAEPPPGFARSLAAALVSWADQQGPPQRQDFRVGVASFPAQATSAESLISAAWRALSRTTAAEPVAEAPSLAGGRSPAGPRSAPVVASPAMEAVYALARRAAPLDLPVLVTGETGVGKELVARAIHEQGPRAAGPLQVINCAAVPENLVEGLLFGHERGAFTDADTRRAGIFEQAHGGTLLLDEVGELAPPAQAALLRVLETKRVRRVGGEREIDVDVRVVAASHRDLEAMCDSGAFRWDLYYRLDGLVIAVPPLRDRPEEIPALVRAFLEGAGAGERSVAPETIELLGRYAWPGNVRQLRNVIERAAALARGPVITAEDLPERVRTLGMSDTVVAPPRAPTAAPVEDDELSFRERVRRFEAAQLLDALRRSGWNQAGAARLLGTTARVVYHKVQVHGLRRGSEELACLEQQLAPLLGLTFADAQGNRAPLKEQLQRYEIELLEQALLDNGFNKTEAARRLRIPLRTLVHKVGQYGIESS